MRLNWLHMYINWLFFNIYYLKQRSRITSQFPDSSFYAHTDTNSLHNTPTITLASGLKAHQHLSRRLHAGHLPSIEASWVSLMPSRHYTQEASAAWSCQHTVRCCQVSSFDQTGKFGNYVTGLRRLLRCGKFRRHAADCLKSCYFAWSSFAVWWHDFAVWLWWG